MKRRNQWLALALVAGGILVVLVVVPIVRVAQSVANHKPTYGLTVPKYLANGDYTLYKDDSAERQRKMSAHRNPFQPSALRIKAGYYVRAVKGASRREVLDFVGFQGKIIDPAQEQRAFSRGLTADGTKMLVPMRQVQPPSGGLPLTCGVVAPANAGSFTGEPTAVCLWADDGTIGIVYDNAAVARKASAIDLGAYADKVSLVRTEVEVHLN